MCWRLLVIEYVSFGLKIMKLVLLFILNQVVNCITMGERIKFLIDCKTPTVLKLD